MTQRTSNAVLRAAADNLQWMTGSLGAELAGPDAIRLDLAGWALSETPEHAVFRAGDTVLDEVCYPIPSPALARKFPVHPKAGQARFAISAMLPRTGEALIGIEFQPDGVATDKTARRRYYARNPFLPGAVALPPGDHVRRAIGTDRQDLYVLGGATAAGRISHVLRLALGRSPTRPLRYLDWGCGCGRLIQYLRGQIDAEIHGADTDGVALDWCRKNIPGVAFQQLPTAPPTPYDDAAFDLITGISVFPHLTEADQNLWLAELQRIAAPGAIVMMTFAGDTILGLRACSDDLLKTIEDAGLYATPAAGSRGGNGAGPGEIRVNTIHTTEYVYEHWGEYFEILSVQPALPEMQDMAVMRRR